MEKKQEDPTQESGVQNSHDDEYSGMSDTVARMLGAENVSDLRRRRREMRERQEVAQSRTSISLGFEPCIGVVDGGARFDRLCR